MTDPLGRTTRWVYDKYDRLASVLDPWMEPHGEYDLDGA
jgi:YD repeat-containing protein